MPQLTLQEVIDRINRIYLLVEQPRKVAGGQAHRPEDYVPHITRRLARLMFGAHAS